MGVLFNEIDTSELGLFFTHREIGSPEPQRETVEIPLRDGLIDLTKELTDVIRYRNRKIKLDFVYHAERSLWPAKVAEVYEAIHGQTMRVILPDTPDRYWHGFVTIASVKDEGTILTISVEIDADPFARTVEEINGGTFTVSGHTDVTINVEHMRGYPRFIVSSQMVVSMDGEDYTLAPGFDRAYGLEFFAEENDLYFDGSGTVTVMYEGGDL